MSSVLPILKNTSSTDTIENFDSIFNDILKNPDSSILKKPKLYEIAMRLLVNESEIDFKEYILKKLIFMFPDNDEFYYYMGFIFKDVDIYKSLMWFKICFDENKNNIDNLLDMFKILFDNDCCNFINYMDKTYDIFNDYVLTDDRIMLLLSTIKMKQHKIKDVENIYEKLLQKINDNKITNESFICTLYSNIGQLYAGILKPNITKNLYEKIIKICKNSKDVDPFLKKKMFENVMMLMFDYNYSDNNERYKLCQEMTTDIYNIENLYDFSDRNKRPNIIKIGYVSADFSYHAVSNFITPIIKNHDNNYFDIYLFVELNVEDVKVEYATHNIKIYNIQNIPTLECCQLIYNLGIDILIDLNGYTDKNRLDIFSKNPAPVQITYLGYPNTLGLSCIKYRITDHVCDHKESTQRFSEKLLRMPDTFLLFKSILQKKKIKTRFIKKNEPIILGSLNKEFKMSENTIRCWRTILEKTKNTKILIKMNNIDNIEYGRNFFMDKLNITTDRLIIHGYCTNTEYVKLLEKIDILLDTFPYSGTTTTCNALYNSIPVVTLFHKDYHVHNVSSSLLINSGAPELVAYSEEEYINKTIALCNKFEKINIYKTTISNNFDKLMNEKKFMNNYEKLLKETYYNHFNPSKQVPLPLTKQLKKEEREEVADETVGFPASNQGTRYKNDWGIVVQLPSEFISNEKSIISPPENTITPLKNSSKLQVTDLEQRPLSLTKQLKREEVAGVPAPNLNWYEYGFPTYPVIISYCNFGYVKFAENCICSLKIMKNHSIVFYCLDTDTYNYLSKLDTGDLNIKYILFDKYNLSKEFSIFNTNDFIEIVRKKMIVLHDALEKYKYIHFIDSDVVCINEPPQTFYKEYCDYDIVFQFDGTTYLYDIYQCVGNFTLKYNDKTMWLLSNIDNILINYPTIGEQEALQKILSGLCNRDIRTIEECKITAYPIEKYSSGYVFKSKIITKKNIKEKCYFFHANWCIGSDAKKEMLNEIGYWLI